MNIHLHTGMHMYDTLTLQGPALSSICWDFSHSYTYK